RDASATYTGDIYCLGCGQMIAKGEDIIAPPSILWGDANSDGKVNAMDAMVVSQYYVELEVEIDLTVSDVNDDGKINAMDAMLISQRYVELIDKFPVEEQL
ncbi:MAG: hypothetical protein IKT35_00895, partial [Clostridia bacterium]|nr:hypothetical protein [Clostridia bacterium]